MSPARRQRSRMNPLLVVLLLVVGVVGAFGTLYARGDVDAAWLDGLLGRQRVVVAGDHVPVIVTSRSLRPGSAVTRGDVWDNVNGRFNTAPIPKGDVNPDWVLRWTDLEGRVMARPKDPMKAFTEADFLPKGTRPGPQSLVPADKRYMAVSEEAFRGLGELGFGDRFDLIAMRKVSDKDMAAAREALAVVGEGRVQEQLRFQLQSGSVVLETPLVMGGKVIRPAAYDAEPRRGKGRDIGIAIAPEETSPLRAAIERGETIYCMPRSNLAGADEPMAPTGQSIEEQLEWLLDQVHRVKFIEGDRHRIQTIDRGGFAPTIISDRSPR